MILFTDTKPATTYAQIEELEKFVGLDFPDDYKEHLLKYNGGRCEPSVFTFIENGSETSSGIDWFLALYDDEYSSIKEAIEIFKIDEKRMPTQILPIAYDPGGNYICISCGADDYGNVYFWDHDLEVDYSVEDDDNYFNINLIARSFTEFLNSLTPLEE